MHENHTLLASISIQNTYAKKSVEQSRKDAMESEVNLDIPTDDRKWESGLSEKNLLDNVLG